MPGLGVTGEPTIEYSARGERTDNNPELFRTVRPYFDEVFGSQSQDSEQWTASGLLRDPRHFGWVYLF